MHQEVHHQRLHPQENPEVLRMLAKKLNPPLVTELRSASRSPLRNGTTDVFFLTKQMGKKFKGNLK